MRIRRRYRKKRLKTGSLLVLLLLTAAFLVSCVAGSGSLWVQGFLGLDTNNYALEPAVNTLPLGGEQVAEMRDIINILLPFGTDLKPFRNTGQLLKHYRDAILNDMLRDNYSLYTGNAAILEQVSAVSPYTVLTVAIPAKDFANTVNRYFGGSVASHKSGSLFSFLPEAEVYTTPLQPVTNNVTVTVERAEETLHAYRLYFRLSDGESVSDPYVALFVKREDGSCYLRALGKGG
jgi:hypothetical protein